MKSKNRNPKELAFRKTAPLRASFLDTLEEMERDNTAYPRKLTQEERKELKKIIQ